MYLLGDSQNLQAFWRPYGKRSLTALRPLSLFIGFLAGVIVRIFEGMFRESWSSVASRGPVSHRRIRVRRGLAAVRVWTWWPPVVVRT